MAVLANLMGFRSGTNYRQSVNRENINKDDFNGDENEFDIDGYDKNGFNSIGVNRKGYISPAKWHEIILTITHASPPSHENEWSAKESYNELNDQDLALAGEWASAEKNNDYTLARMLSARTAEKIAIKFYQSLGYEVDDVSIKQLIKATNKPLSHNFDDWKLFDLLLNGERSIDVKNARTSLNSEVTYVEHCVTRFKKNRSNRDVIIAGMLSPYLKLHDMQNPQNIRYDATIKYLGETTISKFVRLEEIFSKRFLKISINSINFIPRWLFEFPEKFYTRRNRQRYILQQVAIEQIPTIAFCAKNGFNPIPAYLTSDIMLVAT